MALMASKGKPSPRSAVKPLSNAQVSRLAKAHTLVDPMHDLPTGPDRTINEAEIAAQNPKGTSRLLKGVDVVFRAAAGRTPGGSTTSLKPARSSPRPRM